VCRLLLQHGVDVDAQDMHGNTPLAAAARQGNSRVVFSLPPRWHACSIHIIYMMHIYARTCTYIAIHSVYDVYIHTHMYLRCDTLCIYICTYTRTCTYGAIHSVYIYIHTHALALALRYTLCYFFGLLTCFYKMMCTHASQENLLL